MVAEKKRKMGVHPVWAEKASSFDSRSHTHTGGERLNKHSNSSVGSENYQLEIYSQFIFVQKEKRLEGSPSVAPRSGPLIWLISWRVKTYRTLEIVRKKTKKKKKEKLCAGRSNWAWGDYLVYQRMATQTDHLDSLRQQADQIKEDIKQKRKECRDTTMQQVSIQLIIDRPPCRENRTEPLYRLYLSEKIDK